jgi:hypothetical protein
VTFKDNQTIKGIVDRYLNDCKAGTGALPGMRSWAHLMKSLVANVNELICEGFRFARGFVDLPSILSYGDVKRILIHFRTFPENWNKRIQSGNGLTRICRRRSFIQFPCA